jgi:hypothetical protein
MHFRVTIPEHVKSGQTIRISCPDGTEANVKVPKGLKTGDSFIFELPTEQLNDPKSLLDSIKQKGGSAVQDGKKGFMDSDIRNVQDFLVAISMGLFIGLGIIMGFCFGILYATQNYAEPNFPITSQRGNVSHEEAKKAIDSMHKKLQTHLKQITITNQNANANKEIPKMPFFEKDKDKQ